MKNKVVILISGKAGSGKDTLAWHFMAHASDMGISSSCDKISSDMKCMASQDFFNYSDVLNNMCFNVISKLELVGKKLDKKSYDTLEEARKIVEEMMIFKSDWTSSIKKKPIRALLQAYGTEIFQNRVDTNYWDKRLKTRIEKSNNQLTIVSDIRFPSNIDMLKPSRKYHSVLIRINRPNIVQSSHSSETALDDYGDFDYTIINDGSIRDLSNSAKLIVDSIFGKKNCCGFKPS